MEKEPFTQSLDQLTALAHPRRLAVFRLLMRRFPDAVAAGDLATALELPASSLSAVLSQLRQAGLVSQTREGTSLKYTADTTAAAELIGYLAGDCCRGRADVCFGAESFAAPEINPAASRGPQSPPLNVLFLCTGNSARSLMAEAILTKLGQGRFVAHSAGHHPQTAPNPMALDLLASKGHDTTRLRPKHMNDFRQPGAPRMDVVFTVCDAAANEDCPAWPGLPITGHWGQPDPAKVQGSEPERRLAFQQTYGALHNRISAFVNLPIASLSRAALQTEIDTLAKPKDLT